MKSHLRHVLIDKLLAERKEVSFDELVEATGSSVPTIKRDLRFMREELNAPIIYNRATNSYYYDMPDPRKPRSGRPRRELTIRPSRMHSLWYNSDELYVLKSTIEQLEELRNRKGSVLHEELAPVSARLRALFTLTGGMKPSEFIQRVRILDRAKLHRESELFESIGVALCEHRRLQIWYYVPSRKEVTFRTITPQRFVHYDNRWYVDAWCEKANALRTFAVENIRRADILKSEGPSIPVEEIEAQLDRGYGIFHGGELRQAVLVFDATIASYALRRRWHPQQSVSPEADGRIRLTVPFSAESELVGDILHWGSRVEVRSPEELRRAVAAEAEQIVKRNGETSGRGR